MIRFSLMATHSFQQIDYAVEKLKLVADKLGLPLLNTVKA